MAATWAVELTVTNLSSKIISVKATRTDGLDIRTYTLPGILADTHNKPLAQIRAEVVESIWSMYQTELANEAKIVTLLNGWEAALESDLDELET